MQSKQQVIKEFAGGHQDLIKSILVSEDESVLYSGGTDGVVCIWDVNQQQVVQTFGQDKALRSPNEKFNYFHSDSVWQISQGRTPYEIVTAGRDGKVFSTDVTTGQHTMIYETTEPINCVALDSKHIWYGTKDSTVQCFLLQKSKDITPTTYQPAITIPGKPLLFYVRFAFNSRVLGFKQQEICADKRLV